MKYAGYIRISDQQQIGNYSLDAQKRAIEEFILLKGGTLTEIYCDEAQSARGTAKRDEFLRMRQDARKGKFEALVVHKFDRLNRNRTDAMAVKLLLRRDLGIQVLSCTEPSEETAGAMGALVEGIMECIAEWYSNNLATEVSKGKREKTAQGYHTSVPPYGYYRKDKEKLLIPEPNEAKAICLIFEKFRTGLYSYLQIAKLLNDKGYRTKKGRLFSKDAICEILQNTTYIGKVQYQQMRRNTEGKRVYTAPIELYQGQHEPIIDQELFNLCQQVRHRRANNNSAKRLHNSYLLRGLVVCEFCYSNPPANALPTFGKMISQTLTSNKVPYYRCTNHRIGVNCTQRGVKTEEIDNQVIDALMCLKPPKEWKARIIKELAVKLGESSLQTRLDEIGGIINRLDVRWDMGFITDKDEYIEKRQQLQNELAALSPLAEDDSLQVAADMLEHFPKHWQKCGDDKERQHQLISRIVERVYVCGDRVTALTLRADYHIVLTGSIDKEGGGEDTPPEKLGWEEYIIKSGRRDSNPRPLAPHASALPGCATPRNIRKYS